MTATTIQKTRFDVFAGNPGTEAFLEALRGELEDPVRFVVVGVARDVCVTQAVDGLLARGASVEVIRDATWGLGLEREEDTLDRWMRAGGSVSRLEGLKEGRRRGGAG